MTTDSTRIDTLETHLAFQDEAIRQLNNALVAQQGRIDQMQAELERLVATVRDGAHDTRSPPRRRGPPALLSAGRWSGRRNGQVRRWRYENDEQVATLVPMRIVDVVDDLAPARPE